jgi:hypothetical protein
MMQTLSCARCGSDWQREPVKGRPPKDCPDCATLPAHERLTIDVRELDPVGVQIARSITNYRLAIELARSAIRIGKVSEALAALDAAVAVPSRPTGRRNNRAA